MTRVSTAERIDILVLRILSAVLLFELRSGLLYLKQFPSLFVSLQFLLFYRVIAESMAYCSELFGGEH